MEHCRECNSTLTKEEKECWACGSVVAQRQSTRKIFGSRFSACIKYMFFGSAVLTVASLFFDATPPFSKCLIFTVVLMLVKSSADQMLEKKG